MSVKHETDPEDEVNKQSLLPRMPPLIPLPQPGTGYRRQNMLETTLKLNLMIPLQKRKLCI